MANQNSLYNAKSRYVGGGVTETANNRLEWWERGSFSSSVDDITYSVEPIYEGRLDKIAAVFYGEPKYWWVIAQYNNILDPFTEIVTNRRLLIPSPARIDVMLSQRQGGVVSTKEPVNTISPIIV